MNVFRSLARSLWSALDFRPRPTADKAPATSRLRDGFDRAYRSALRQPTHVDAFDPGARRAPLDLTGGVKPAQLPIEEPRPAPVLPPSPFVASLDDLGLLVEPPAEAPTVSASPPGTSVEGQRSPGDSAPFSEAPEPARGSASVAADAPAPAPAPDPLADLALAPSLAQPEPEPEPAARTTPPEDGALALGPAAPLVELGLPSVPELPAEGLLELSDFEPVVDSFERVAPLEQPRVAAASVPRADAVLSLEAFGPVVDSFEPAPAAAPRAPAQHTVELLMPATPRELPVRPQAAEQFSTAALLDLVSQLDPTEAPALPPEVGTAQAPANEPTEPRPGQDEPAVDAAGAPGGERPDP